MLLNDMDLSMLILYAQLIEESEIRERKSAGKSPRVDEQSQPKP